MTSPQIDSHCLNCVDLRASLHRTDRELARVITERDRYHAVAQERAARATENLERARLADRKRDLVLDAWDRVKRIIGLESSFTDEDVYTELTRLVSAERNSLMPGWTCRCGCWNGLAKAERMTCRACDALRPARAGQMAMFGVG